MKPKLFFLLLSVAASVGTMFASYTQVDGIWYNFNSTNNTAEVTYAGSTYDTYSNEYAGVVTIPNSVTYSGTTYSVTSIGEVAFFGCSSLTSVTIPNSVTSIGYGAFAGCSSLTSVTIGNGVTSIGYGAFMECSGLTSVTIGNNVTSIGEYTFSSCSGLTSVTIPNSVTSIGYDAFCNCSSLTSVTIPSSVTSIGSGAFRGCSGLTSVTIPNSVTSIGEYAFYGCSGLTSVTIPSSVTSIGEYAFEGCSGLTSVTIPNSVTSIGDYAFMKCRGLTSVTIGNTVTSIGSGAFYGCIGLTSVTIPNSVTSIGAYAFSWCGLTSLSVEAGNTVYDSRNNCNAIIETSTNTLIFGCQNTTIPNSVTSIGDGAFYYCYGLTSVTIPNSVTSIGISAFYGCIGLTSVTIPNSVTSIGDYAFSYCRGLTSVTIPNSVTSIGDYAFYDCSGLTSVTIEAETPPALGSSAFYNTNNCPIYVPCTIDAYTSAWPEYANRIIIMPLNYQITGNVNIEGAGSVQLPQYICDSVIIAVSNYGYHFTKWSDGNTDNPRTIVLTQDTTFTAEFAYDRVGTCGKDLALVWSYDPTNKVLTIGNAGSFTENMQFGLEAPNEMEELVIGNFVTAIGANAFAGISSLKKVSIGESVKTIEEQAFYNCVNLETIFNYRPTPTNAYSNAFDGVDKFECKLYVLTGSIDMYKNAYVWRDFYYTYAIGAEEATVTTNDVTVEPQDNAATVTWPTSENAASYTIQITKDGVVFCTLIFNGNGQLTGIAFALDREGTYHAPAAIMTANGLQFTVTGLSSNTLYGYSLTTKDAANQVLASYSGDFTTTGGGVTTEIDNTSFHLYDGTEGTRKIIRNGRILILRGDKTYTPTGQEVK